MKVVLSEALFNTAVIRWVECPAAVCHCPIRTIPGRAHGGRGLSPDESHRGLARLTRPGLCAFFASILIRHPAGVHKLLGGNRRVADDAFSPRHGGARRGTTAGTGGWGMRQLFRLTVLCCVFTWAGHLFVAAQEAPVVPNPVEPPIPTAPMAQVPAAPEAPIPMEPEGTPLTLHDALALALRHNPQLCGVVGANVSAQARVREQQAAEGIQVRLNSDLHLHHGHPVIPDHAYVPERSSGQPQYFADHAVRPASDLFRRADAGAGPAGNRSGDRHCGQWRAHAANRDLPDRAHL